MHKTVRIAVTEIIYILECVSYGNHLCYNINTFLLFLVCEKANGESLEIEFHNLLLASKKRHPKFPTLTGRNVLFCCYKRLLPLWMPNLHTCALDGALLFEQCAFLIHNSFLFKCNSNFHSAVIIRICQKIRYYTDSLMEMAQHKVNPKTSWNSCSAKYLFKFDTVPLRSD